MSPITCQEVAEQIELYAARACDEPTRSAIQQHLARCPACARSNDEALQLVGLLDVHFQEPERLQRLRDRLEVEDQRQPVSVRFLPLLRRGAALAALLLVTVGLSWFIGISRVQEGSDSGGLVVALHSGAKENIPAPPFAMVRGAQHPRDLEKATAKTEKLVFPLNLGGKSPEEFRQYLRATERTDRLPPPPVVNLELEVRNTQEQEIRIALGASETALQLDLQGPGVITANARNDLTAAFLMPKTVTLASDQSHTLPITRLVYGSRRQIRYAYWTAPGEYTLTIRLNVAISPAPPGTRKARMPVQASGDFGYVTVISAPIQIQVALKP
jgi:hypothetical protein